jgi:hypothetical protein
MKKQILIFLIVILSGCSTSKSTSILNYSTPLPQDAKVEILGQGQVLPEGAKLLGHIKIGDTGFSTNCGYEKVIRDAEKQARVMGGNYLQITKHKEPNMGSTCHRIEADIYLVKK